MMWLYGPVQWSPGVLCQAYVNKYQAPYQQARMLSESSLQPIGSPVRLLPKEIDEPTSAATDDWQVNVRGLDLTRITREGKCSMLRWESMGPNRDFPRDSAPPPSRLEVVEIAAR